MVARFISHRGVLLVASLSLVGFALAQNEQSKVGLLVELDRDGGNARAKVATPEDAQLLAQSDEKTIRTAMRIDLETGQVDPLDAGLPWYWLVFGFGAQFMFTGRMLVQWIASERAKASVVPASFWILSALGGLMLLTYFLRRGDPVGVTGQAFGLSIYARNLIFIRRGGVESSAAPVERTSS